MSENNQNFDSSNSGCFPIFMLILFSLVGTKIFSFTQNPPREHTSEPKSIIGALNRAQQAYHFEKQSFANSTEELGITLNPDYSVFKMINKGNIVYSYTGLISSSEKGYRRSPATYTSAITYNKSEAIYLSIFCGSKTDNPEYDNLKLLPPHPFFVDGNLTCPEGFIEVH